MKAAELRQMFAKLYLAIVVTAGLLSAYMFEEYGGAALTLAAAPFVSLEMASHGPSCDIDVRALELRSANGF